MREKRKLSARGISLISDMYFQFLTVRNWVANVVVKFHNDPTVNESDIVIFSETGLMVCGKKRGFWERKREKTKLVGRGD